MNYLKTNNVGVDASIKRVQNYLYSQLTSKWDVNKLDIYGRVYKNTRKDIIIPEYYIGENEYKEVLFDDNRDGIIFFNVGDIKNVSGDVINTDIDVICALNLKAINGNTDRTDAEVQADVFKQLTMFRSTLTINHIETGLNNVYSDFSGVAKIFLDMQDYHHFKIGGKINYTNNDKC